METIINNTSKPRNGRTMAGIIILVIGGILLIQQFNLFFIPAWLFSWPMWLIGWGLYLGAKHHYKKTIWAVMIALGVGFLFTENIPNAEDVVWPIGLIGLGAWMVLRHQKRADTTHFNESSFKEL
jgi:hypothetical protein